VLARRGRVRLRLTAKLKTPADARTMKKRVTLRLKL
jgi:hypothetical protein